MALQAAMVRELGDFARKRSHSDAIKHFPPLFIDFKRLEYLRLLLSTGEERSVQTPDVVECVVDHVEDNPGVSTRQMATELNVPQMTVWRILREQLLYPCCIHRVQGLKATDVPSLEILCRWFDQQCAEPNFLLLVLFSGETGFDRDGIINFHSHHLYAEDNPRGLLQSRHRQQFSINVSTGNVGHCFVGPRVFHVGLQATTTEITC